MHTRNASFQQWQALLTNRTKRNRTGEFLVHGVRPLRLALERAWPVQALLRPDRPLSDWAEDVWRSTPGQHAVLADELMAELGQKDDSVPELIAVLALPPDDLDRLLVDPALHDRSQPVPAAPLITVFDRPASPGNIGTLVRSVDAFGGTGVVVTGHAADPYDPRCVRASTGSMLTVPVVRVPSHAEVLAWVQQQAAGGLAAAGAGGAAPEPPARWAVLGLDEGGRAALRRTDLTGPTVLVVGNETRGLTRAWRDACDEVVSIPMVGAASSLNAAVAGSVVLHEALAQRLR
ncbi:TrmH family RNA methyltransferase [Ornithinimicrobium cryptoxanthini]|uniref:rRNA methyltransferase n=1 Tax=Ornithinimicrobium cryptoxanthini TaxID=2934161 RepID=A0ABY4YG89_9MICO|nr:TrmH family RNA methyltransferase [Ornithinimicrobium cryptoxanthini]USQ75781.1 rRNA methyltransferase [Ornithinimicrobium cryptoxanthini]